MASTQNNIADLVDRFGALENELKKVEALIKERDELRKRLAEACDEVGEGEVTLQGHAFTVMFSKAPAMREIKPAQFGDYLTIVGIDDFLKSCKVSTTAADKLLGEQDKARLFTVSKGSRRLKACIASQVVEVAKPISTEDQATTAFYASLAGIIDGLTPRAPGPSH